MILLFFPFLSGTELCCQSNDFTLSQVYALIQVYFSYKAHGCRNQQDFRTCPSVSQRHSNPFNTAVWVRDSGCKLRGEVQTGHKEESFCCEDSQAVGHVDQWGCAVPYLQIFITQPDKALSILLWAGGWPLEEPFQPELWGEPVCDTCV